MGRPSVWIELVALSWLSATGVQAACTPRPLQVPIQDVEFGEGAAARGVALGVGNPRQNISFFVSGDNNETYVYDKKGYCDDSWSDAACKTYRGGFYATGDSKDDKPRDPPNTDSLDAFWIKDTLGIQSNMSLKDFGFGIAAGDLNQGYVSQAQLGLSRNSTLLNMLKDEGHIDSRAYSMYWGLVGGTEERQKPGSLVLGGVDESLAEDINENYTAKLNFDSTCGTGMLVTINDLVLNWPNSTDTSLFGGSLSSVIQACISPAFSGLMTLPYEFANTFYELAGGNFPNDEETRSMGINYFTMLYDPDGVYFGDFSIHLQNGITIRIPNSELVTADRYIDSDTGKVETNNTVRNLVINSIQDVNNNDLPVIGRLFLTSAYLSVNHDDDSFTLWNANPKAKDTTIKSLSAKNERNEEFCNGDETDNPENGSPTSTSSPSPLDSKSLSGGAIAGIVVGVVALLALVALAAFFFLRRRSKARQSASPDYAMVVGNKPPTPPYHSRPNLLAIPSEMPADQAAEKRNNVGAAPSELDGTGVRGQSAQS